MKVLLAIILLIVSLSVNARTEQGCYAAGLYGQNGSSQSYAGAEFGCEVSESSLDWLGAYAGVLITFPAGDGNNSSRDYNGINFGIRKNLKLVSFAKYRHIIPYIGFGAVLTLRNDRTLEIDKGEIGSAKLTAFVPSIGLKVPVSKKLGINPNIRYVLPTRQENDAILFFSVAIYNLTM